MQLQGIRRRVPVTIKRRVRRVIGRARIVAVPFRHVPLPDGTLDCVLARNEYGAYCVPRSAHHRPAAQAVLQARVYERDTIALMRSTPGDVIHAGTFFGDFLPALAAREDTVWAFEPNLESYRCASITTALNDLQNVRLTHAALSDAPGEATLAVSNRSGVSFGGGSHLVADSGDGFGYETVPLATIDEAVPENRIVGVLELDVEGHEQQALLGAMATIRRCRPLLILETLPPEAWLAQHLPGYRVTRSVNGNKVLAALS
jgi:FkbM family methyltransferase